jgi:DNA processing protein
MTMDNVKFQFIKYLYILSKIKNLGSIRIKSLIQTIHSLDELKRASVAGLCTIGGIDKKIAGLIYTAAHNTGQSEKDFDSAVESCKRGNIRIISFLDDNYPANLKNIYDAPVLLYYKGKLNPKDSISLSVVGTRYPTEYGKKACTVIVEELSRFGLPVISGMARGIDSISHKTAIENENITYAILGSGADVIYPRENIKLYEKIIEYGVIISEFEPGTQPEKVNFPRRNRIISGISIGTIIIETGLKGGSMITAEFALDQNREVFAVPGYIFSKSSEGCNNLIKRSQAKLVTCAGDIIGELDYRLQGLINISSENKKEEIRLDMNFFEKSIYDVLGSEPVNIDSISEKTGLSISDCLVNLLSLEFKSIIKQIPGKLFIRI